MKCEKKKKCVCAPIVGEGCWLYSIAEDLSPENNSRMATDEMTQSLCVCLCVCVCVCVCVCDMCVFVFVYLCVCVFVCE